MAALAEGCAIASAARSVAARLSTRPYIKVQRYKGTKVQRYKGTGAISTGAIGRSGALVDVMFGEHREVAAAKAFFESDEMVTDITPDRVTTDGHDSYPGAIRTVLGGGVWHRDSKYLNNRLEQDHRGVKGRYGPMREFKCPRSAGELGRAYDEFHFLCCCSRVHQKVSADYRRFHFLLRPIRPMPGFKSFQSAAARA
jgi:transposase-like protein